MKITLSSRTESASVLLWVIVVAMVVILGGCTVVHLRKLIKRMDGIQDKRFRETNDTSIYMPPGSGNPVVSVTAKSLAVEDRDIPYFPPDYTGSLSWDETTTSSGDNALSRIMVVVNVDEKGVPELGMARTDGWEKGDLSDFGIPLDQDGVPETWSRGEPTIPNSVPVDLLRSIDLKNWSVVHTLRVRTNVPSFFEDMAPTNRALYGAVRR